MTELQLDQIPEFIKKASFFKPLNGEGSIIIPVYKENDEITSLEDLLLYFQVIDYCMLATRYIKFHIYQYVFDNREEIIKNEELINYIKKYPEIYFLVIISTTNKWYSICCDCGINNYIIALKILNNSIYKKDLLLYTVCTNAVQSGSFHCIKYMYESYKEGFEWRPLIISAARYGYLNIIIYAKQHGYLSENYYNKLEVAEAAAAGGHLNCLKYLYEYDEPWIGPHSYKIIEAALFYKHLDCLKFAFEKGCIPNTYFEYFYKSGITYCDAAILTGKLEFLIYIRSHGCPWDSNTFEIVSANGNLEIMKYMYENGCPWDCETIKMALFHGHFDCLKFAFENGCIIDTSFCKYYEYAIIGTNIDCFKYIYARVNEYNSPALFAIAAENGSLEIMKYLYEIGNPWNCETIEAALYYNHFDCLKFAFENGCIPNEDGISKIFNCSYYKLALKENNIDCFKYLHKYGFKWDAKLFALVAKYGNLEIMKYMYKNECPWDCETIEAAISYNRIDCLKYLQECGCYCVDAGDY